MLAALALISALLSAPAAGPMLQATAADRLGKLPQGLGLKPGQTAPDAALTNISGETVKLSSLYAKGPTMLVFYRGGWCPFCNLQLHELAARKADFDKRGVGIAAISVELPGEESKTQAKNAVPFPMLSDPLLAAHRLFRVVHTPGAQELAALKGYGVDLEARSGQQHHSFAVPAVFLISQEGTVLWSHVDEDYTTRPSTDQLLHQLDVALGR
jgi:peroxiredoxin